MNKTIKIEELIFTKIKHRYHFQKENRIGGRNIRDKLIIDSFYPAAIANSIAYPEGLITTMTSRKGYAISERVANDLDSKRLHISELTTMLGYTKTDIGKILQRAKNKEFNIVLVGLGGTGANFLHFVYEMMQWTGKGYIFNNMLMMDDDDFDIPNMLRIPFIPQFDSNETRASKINTTPTKFSNIANSTIRRSQLLTEEFINTNDSRLMGLTNKTIIYGAPDIGTREMLTNSIYTFIAATHKDNEYSIVENPAVDNDLMMETYGKINLSKFFLNHLSMTIEFLKHIGEREFPLGKNEDAEGREIQRENETIVRHNFADRFSVEFENGFKAGAKKLFIADENRTLTEIELGEI